MGPVFFVLQMMVAFDKYWSHPAMTSKGKKLNLDLSFNPSVGSNWKRNFEYNSSREFKEDLDPTMLAKEGVREFSIKVATLILQNMLQK